MTDLQVKSSLIRIEAQRACGMNGSCGINDPASDQFCVGCGRLARHPLDNRDELTSELRQSVKRAAWTLLILNILDVITTYVALAAGLGEGNPLSAFLIHYHLLIPLKAIICTLLLFAAYSDRIQTKLSRRVAVAWTVVGIYALVPILNLITYLRTIS